MNVRNGFVDTIGKHAPSFVCAGPSEATGCDIYGKAEFLNPGGSVKDRAAWAIVKDAEESGRLGPGGIIVEGTAGNTGIGLALVGRARGYRSVIVIPETQTEEKKQMLRLCGAELKEVPALPYRDPNNYVHVSERLAKELNESDPKGAIWAQQFDNVANRRGPLPDHRTGNLGADGRQARRLRLCRGHRGHLGWRQRIPARAQTGDQDRLGRSARCRALPLLCPR